MSAGPQLPPNFRDIGGVPGADGRTIRVGRLFRSATPERLKPEDAARLRVELRIGAVIDLRTPRQSPNGSGPLGERPSRRIQINLYGPSEDQSAPGRPAGLEQELSSLPERCAANIGDVFRAITESESPVLFHCVTGKDRTGFVAALLLKLFGASCGDVIADYMETANHLPHIMSAKYISDRAPASAGEPPSEAGMRALLARLDSEFGGARGYLEANGIQPAAIDAFINQMLR
jgi:protein tyrosine/serine phosphatase